MGSPALVLHPIGGKPTLCRSGKPLRLLCWPGLRFSSTGSQTGNMDQAIAALCGAGIGVVGTLGASWLTYAGARRQARDQGRVEHARQLRTERREAYLSFMELLEPLEHLPALPASSLSEEEFTALKTRVESIPLRGEYLLTRIRLCGPDEIANRAGDLLGEIGRMVHLFLNKSEDQHQIDIAFEKYWDAQSGFVNQVQNVMTEPPV